MRLLLISLLAPIWLNAASSTLDIYWADVEGGAATLIVTPGGESLLVDTGNPRPDDRDAKRVFEAAKQAGLKKIDYVLITHFHGDHVGGLESLLKMIPVTKFLDHGDSVEDNAGWKTYLKLSEGRRQSLKPGHRIPLRGVDIRVVAAHGGRISKPINGGGANALCASAELKKPDPTDNAQSAGFLLSMGKFQFLDLGDLTWNKEHELACPENMAGAVDLYQVTHHGLDQSSAPQLVWAIKPQVAIMNNGPRKGGHSQVFETLKKSPGIQDVWQLHWSEVSAKEQNAPEQVIANMTPTAECKGHSVKVSVEKNGKYTVTNSRNGFSKTYQAR
ncbi:MAG TPA: MBL fold metallo-hydrolase [Bryobacteraceae bacterium]|nr:MBL fold metallo-hydrolase [Bryobacteraceae bacterium]